VLCVQEHLQEVKRREEAQQAALAAKREEADRIYTRLKAEKEAAQAAQDEQDFLVNLLQQEEVESRLRQKEQEMRAYRVRFTSFWFSICHQLAIHSYCPSPKVKIVQCYNPGTTYSCRLLI
jgi:predicted RecB family nuclease